MGNDDDETLYECDCFRVVQYTDDEGSTNVSIYFVDRGVDLILTEEEFGHFVEAMSGLQPLPLKSFQH